MLKAINLTKSYQNKIALAGLSVEVAPGEVVCLLGGAGAGKSTAIELFLGLKSPSSGTANVEGVAAARATKASRAGLAYVPSEFAWYPELTGRENVEFLVGISELDPLTDQQITELLIEFGLDPRILETRAAEWTVAEKQRLGLAVGVAREAKAFLLDSPTAKLSGDEALDLASLIRRLATGEVGGQPAAVLMATANPEVAWGAAKVALLEKGRVKALLDGAKMAGDEMAQRCAAHMQS
jgi:ABC-2 type transport system ATP-binding protein